MPNFSKVAATVAILILLASPTTPAAQQSPTPPATAAPVTIEALRARAQERMRGDQAFYTREQFQDIETLYQAANRDLRAPDAKQKLVALVDKYPDANRSGCAILYLAQLSQGEEAEKYLKQAIEKHENAWYGNGTQVGAFARFQLARLYWQASKQNAARSLAQEIRTKFPDAVDHNGRTLVDLLANSPLR
jgi:tetratricopeptide (TPR) repeat protein